jgi:LPXTG-motif cell wall-anchored protein
LSPATSEQRYVKVGDKVQEQGATQLNWTATNADSVKIDPLGVVTGAGGNPTIQISPEKDSPGPVDETHTYKITATNICGGSATSVATVHLTGSIDPEPQVVAAAEPPPELPNTASPLPLLGLTGLLFLGTGSLLKRRRMK